MNVLTLGNIVTKSIHRLGLGRSGLAIAKVAVRSSVVKTTTVGRTCLLVLPTIAITLSWLRLTNRKTSLYETIST